MLACAVALVPVTFGLLVFGAGMAWDHWCTVRENKHVNL